MALFTAVLGYVTWLVPVVISRGLLKDGIHHTQADFMIVLVAGIVTATAAVLVFTAVGTRLVGQTATGLPFEVTLRFLYRQPASTSDLAWQKIAGLACGVVGWFVALTPALMLIMHTGSWLFRQHDPEMPSAVARVAVWLLYTGWITAGILLAIVLTGRKWVGQAFTLGLLVSAVLAIVFPVLMHTDYQNLSDATKETIYKGIAWALVSVAIAIPVASVTAALMRGLLSPARLAIGVAVGVLLFGYHVAEVVTHLRTNVEVGLLDAAILAMLCLAPLAPMGLIPLACNWGRRG